MGEGGNTVANGKKTTTMFHGVALLPSSNTVAIGTQLNPCIDCWCHGLTCGSTGCRTRTVWGWILFLRLLGWIRPPYTVWFGVRYESRETRCRNHEDTRRETLLISSWQNRPSVRRNPGYKTMMHSLWDSEAGRDRELDRQTDRQRYISLSISI